MNNKNRVIQRMINKDRDCLNELYDRHIHHIQRVMSTSSLDSIDQEKIITQLFCTIWSSPEIFNNEKHISVAITKLCLALTNSKMTSIG